MTTTIVNIRHEPYDVYMGRPGQGEDGYFGNPIRVGWPCPVCRARHTARGATIECFKAWFARRVVNDFNYAERVLALRGKRLGCFCKGPGVFAAGEGAPCHVDVIAAWIARQPADAEARIKAALERLGPLARAGLIDW